MCLLTRPIYCSLFGHDSLWLFFFPLNNTSKWKINGDVSKCIALSKEKSQMILAQWFCTTLDHLAPLALAYKSNWLRLTKIHLWICLWRFMQEDKWIRQWNILWKMSFWNQEFLRNVPNKVVSVGKTLVSCWKAVGLGETKKMKNVDINCDHCKKYILQENFRSFCGIFLVRWSKFLMPYRPF